MIKKGKAFAKDAEKYLKISSLYKQNVESGGKVGRSWYWKSPGWSFVVRINNGGLITVNGM